MQARPLKRNGPHLAVRPGGWRLGVRPWRRGHGQSDAGLVAAVVETVPQPLQAARPAAFAHRHAYLHAFAGLYHHRHFFRFADGHRHHLDVFFLDRLANGVRHLLDDFFLDRLADGHRYLLDDFFRDHSATAALL